MAETVAAYIYRERPAAGPVAAMTGWHGGMRALTLHITPMTDVAAARDEFGPGLADAKAFVLDVACNHCGVTADETEGCPGCDTPVCGCLTDPHHEDVRY